MKGQDSSRVFNPDDSSPIQVYFIFACRHIHVHLMLSSQFTRKYNMPENQHPTASNNSLIDKITHITGILIVSAATTAITSCTVPATSSMSLGSVSSMSGSSASSAASHHHHKSAYFIDVRETTAAAIMAQAPRSEILRGISRAATQHGISDWESEQVSYVALGEGLRLGGLNENQIQTWISSLSNGNEQTARLIMQGFQKS